MSNRTTNFGPLVSLRTSLSRPSDPITLDLSNASLMVRSGTTVGDASSVGDDELRITDVDGLTANLAFRSGNTTYLFASSSTAIES